MSGPYKILDGSDAAAAVAEIDGMTLTSGNVAAQVRSVTEKYGADKMTSVAAERAVQELVTNQNANPKTIARDIVGSTVANPNIAALNAQREAANVPENASPQQKENAALNASESAAEAAGASGQAARNKTQAYLDQGVSPAQAAMLGTLAVVAPAVGSNPDATGYEIYGYLTAHVTDYVSESYCETEERKVTGVATHEYDNSLIVNTPATLHIDCAHYLAEAQTDTSALWFSTGIYSSGYDVTQLAPISITGASVSAYALAYTGIKTTMFSGAYDKTFLNLFDFFGVICTVGAPKNVGLTATTQNYKTKIGIFLSKCSLFK